MKFINREIELKALRNKWAKGTSQLIIVYGKRRVGKTELIKQFIKDKEAVYFLADKRTALEQLRELGQIMGDMFNDDLLKSRGFESWLEVFNYIKKHKKGKFIFAIDEYPYLVEADKAISSIFQKGWDEILKDSGIFLILSGSSIGMMESEALTYKAPLYGRRTGQFLIKSIPFKEARKFFPKKDFDECLGIYTITGGIPAYILQWDPALSVNDNIKEKVFLNTEFLHNEVEFILKEEFREPKNYLSILKAISWGKRKFGEIVNETGLEKNFLTKYLMTLERLQIIEREVPVTEDTRQKSRKGLYTITDNFFRFWFQYVFPYKSDLEIQRYDEVLRKMRESFKMLEAWTYETICRQMINDFRDELFTLERVGKWWENEKEIDVVALNSQTKDILFGEVKWSEKQVGTNIYAELKEKAAHVDWKKGSRKERYILFSKSGFTRDMIELAKKDGVYLIHKDKLIK
ncbi:MAG: ATP-binding protein [Candidatus Omnitrophota bacterium]|nr:ATP-binding protein [Candidatus Omnitrophota bacterium]